MAIQPTIDAYTGAPAPSNSVSRPMVAQPPVAMSSMKPTAQALEAAESQRAEESAMRLRGGGFNDVCPGRICFVIPCPIPCNFCFIPLPC